MAAARGDAGCRRSGPRGNHAGRSRLVEHDVLAVAGQAADPSHGHPATSPCLGAQPQSVGFQPCAGQHDIGEESGGGAEHGEAK